MLLAVATAGPFATASAALVPAFYVKVTAQGPQPKVARAVVGFSPVVWYSDVDRGKRVIFPSGACHVRVSARIGVQHLCYFKKPGRYAYRIEGLPGSGVVIVRAARPGERYCGGPCK